MLAVQITPTFLTDSHGHRTHAILPYEEWELLTARAIRPDTLDLKTIARLERDMALHPLFPKWNAKAIIHARPP